MSNGICLIGRDDRCGLGSQTADFCQGMRPDRLVIVDVGSRKGKIEIPRGCCNEVKYISRAGLSLDRVLVDIFRDITIVVSFETYYAPQLPIVARSMGVKSVLFPNHEWTSDSDAGNSNCLICLSETDYRKYWCLPMPGVTRVKMDWPACPEVHVPNRVINWPPKTFVHIAGNASHNRDGTREVLQAAEYLKGTGAKLVVYANFNTTIFGSVSQDAPLELRNSAPTRKELFDGCDCLVQPRRLGGHSLPINEAMGEGIPVITLLLPDWKVNPYTVPAHSIPKERFGPGLCNVWRADPNELGQKMREMALGVDCQSHLLPKLPSWQQFREWGQKEIT